MLQTDELRAKQLKAELAEGGRAQKRYQKIGLAVLILLLLVTFHMVGSCSKNSVLEARQDDAVTAFTRGAKALASSSPAELQEGDRAFDVVLESRKSYEPYVYKAVIQLMSYNWYKTNKKTVKENCLPQAEKFLAEAVKLNPKSHEAHYYLAALAYFQDNNAKCMSELDECLKLSEALEGKPKQQWTGKVEACKAALTKTPPGPFDILPPQVMMPKWDIVK